MQRLMGELKRLIDSELSCAVSNRMDYFRRQMSEDEIFYELCFCLLSANFTSEGSWKIQKKLGPGFAELPEPALALNLRRLGHRFPNVRAKYIVKARRLKPRLPEILNSTMEKEELRKWFVSNVHGFGYKEASHFLRNVGKGDYAIVDFHILDVLSRHGLFSRPKTLTPKKYLEAEHVLGRICDSLGMRQGELDLYLWYLETGKVLK